MMKIRVKISLIALLIILYACNSSTKQVVRSKPNIIIILADDFGLGDIQSYYPGNKISTPNLDNLSTEGMNFYSAHSSSAVCTPTRYGLLTGRYNWRTALQESVITCYEPPLIKKERITLPEMLKENGYNTACIGKWHLGWNWEGERPNERTNEGNILYKYRWDYSKSIKGGPNDHGFDYYFGTPAPNVPPFAYIENDHVVELPTATYEYEEGPISMPKVFDGSPMAPGWKFDQILPDITKAAVEYIHDQSQTKQPFFLYFSMTSPHEPVAPSKNFAGKSGIAPIADFIMETDWSVGQVLKAVEDAAISENTLIIFTADNGHSYYTGLDKLLEAEHFPNGIYRGYKGDIWEGGHRVPFIVKWAGKVEANSSTNNLVSVNDIFATCAELVGNTQLPKNTAEDSFSFLNMLLNNKKPVCRNSLIAHSVHGEFAYLRDSMKIVFALPERNLKLSRGKAAKQKLYNLNIDPGEKQDIALEYPELVRELTNELRSIVERGTSRNESGCSNDVKVLFDTIQTQRWATPILN